MPIHFKYYCKNDLLSYTRVRKFETKLGERIAVVSARHSLEAWLANPQLRYVILGIPEDLGVIANYGTGGTHTLWSSFLSAFLNVQHNDYFEGDHILLLGHFDFSDIKSLIEKNAHDPDERVAAYRHAVNTLDEEVEELVKRITTRGKVPIIIGGGHNNAYPLIKGTAKGLCKAGSIPQARINAVNLDAHTDFRPEEGRHSGNAFRYAETDGYLYKYCVIGVHENYLPQNVLMDFVGKPFLNMVSYEDIFIREKMNFIQAMAHATEFTDDTFTGVELDLDSIENVLSSAQTPAGITVLQARQYVHFMGSRSKAAYLHLCEGASQLEDGSVSRTTGKLVSYLVTDFIKASGG